MKHLFGYEALEINPSSDGQTLQLSINEKPYKLPELGAGLVQFILVLAHAAIKKPAWILIDEPELNLHPTLQLEFLTTLGSYPSEGVLFATHSYGLVRAGADFIYSVRKVSDGKSELALLEGTPRLSEFLGELSFSGYRELGFDKILLVEGRTEIKTFQQFLRKYDKDHQIVALPLGGDALINGGSEGELEEIKRISENVYAIIDSERTAAKAPLAKNREAFVESCRKANILCHVLERRATENYFSDGAVKKVKGEKFSALSHYEVLEQSALPWAKTENWRIAREMTKEEIEATDLGKFLSSL